MKRHIFIGYLLLAFIFTSACSDWLDVRPKTAVEDDQLFSRELGFKEALTGVYIQMAKDELYGQMLSYGFIDQLAQRYPSTSLVMNAALYEYTSLTNEAIMLQIWSSMYNVIANVNNLLAHLESHGSVITTNGYRETIEGEARALRAFLHFDLLRMFGPVYKEHPAGASIPYRTSFDRESKPLSPANEVLGFIEQDLLKAEQLLANDLMHIDFTSASYYYTGDIFLGYRNYRFNLYAVKALLARVYLWKGDHANAAAYATRVIEGVNAQNQPLFQLADATKDRIYSSELLFSLNMENFTMNSAYIVGSHQQVYEMYTTSVDGMNDVRFREGLGFYFYANYAITAKYDQTVLSTNQTNILPLIRLSEMYYILCECETSMQKAADYLSTVRVIRGVEPLGAFTGEEDKINKLEIEYRKEFYAEGQLWYFLKRHFRETFLFCPVIPEMQETHYVFPVPENEIVFGSI
jgi:hypothetical protein